jgi:long-chain fatty acid transport protein
MKRPIGWLVSGVVAILAAGPAWGASFALSENGAKAQAMGGAFVGQADDPSAVWYNPAGLMRQERRSVSLGANFFLPDISADDVNGVRRNTADGSHADGESGTILITGNNYATWRVSDRVGLGVGINTPFGLAVDWEDDAFVRYQSSFAELRTLFFTPAIALQLSDRISAGIGVSYIYADAELERKLYLGPGLSDGTFQLAGEAREWGYSAGVQAVLLESAGPIDRVTLGATYHSAVVLKFGSDDSVVRFTVPAEFSSSLPNSAASTTIDLPEIWTMGLSAQLGGRTTVNLDVSRFGWSTFDAINIRADNDTTQHALDNAEILPNPVVRNYEDTWTVRVGGEYRFDHTWAARLGYAFDQTPITDEHLDPILPDADRHFVMAGGGFRHGAFSVDAAYTAVFYEDVSTSSNAEGFNVDYDSFSHIFSLALNYQF